MLSASEHRDDRAIVFGRTKHGMERLSKKISDSGLRCASIHGNKSQPQRERALAGFKAGDITVLVATDVAARGLDIPDVKRIYNFELPEKAEAYVHRIGRTARAGKDGNAISFCAKEDMDTLYAIQELIGMDIPVASGRPYTREETQGARDRVKANKQAEGERQSTNRKKRSSSRGQEGQRQSPKKRKRSNSNGQGAEGGGNKKKYQRRWVD
jgi:ATP-dependent RNA helicase RhlE